MPRRCPRLLIPTSDFGIGKLSSGWRRATKRAGLVGKRVHDLRRTSARNYRRAGVSEGEIMTLAGWRTRAMFDRYNIIDEADLAQAVAERFSTTSNNGKQSEPSTVETDSVTSSRSNT